MRRALAVAFVLIVVAAPIASAALRTDHAASADLRAETGVRDRATPGGDADKPGLTTSQAGVAHPGHPPKPTRFSKPTLLHLKKAHSAVFDVRKLKSTVVKIERAEDGGPNGAADTDSDADSASATTELPAKASLSSIAAAASAPAPDSSFGGLDFATWGAGHPPDENGDVGPTYYIQTINTSIGIYDKSNGNRVAAFTFNAFMSQGHFGNLCDTNNFGDPVVLYDSYEDRWFITDFAFTLDGSGNVNPQTVYQCFAVSKTGDPVNGGWNFYSILDPGGLGDYPKFGVWPDGIYMSANMFGYAAGASYSGYHVWALNKQQMYAGAPSPQVVDFTGNTSRLHAPAGQLAAPGRHAAGGVARVLRLDRAVPERALDLQVPRRLGQDLDLDVHRAEHAARDRVLAERDAGERVHDRERSRRPGDQGDGPGPVHQPGRCGVASGSTTPSTAGHSR